MARLLEFQPARRRARWAGCCPGVCLALPVALGWCGCRPNGSATDAEPPSHYIAFVGAGATDPLWPVLRASAERYAQTHRYHEIRYLVSEVVSPQEQARLIRGVLGDMDLRGLCVQVIDAGALSSVLRDASVHGVHVVTMLKDVPAQLRRAYCGIDEDNIGRSLAQAVKEATGGTGNVMALVGRRAAPEYHDRLAAFQDEIEKSIDIHVLAYAECDGDRVGAQKVLHEYTRRYPSVSGWVMLDSWAFSRWGDSGTLLPKPCPIVTVNPFPGNWKYLESGECFALIGGDYERIGRESLRLCELAIGTAHTEKMEILVPADIVRATELAAYRVKWINWSAPVIDAGAPESGGSL